MIQQHVRRRKPRTEFGKVIVGNGYTALWFIFRGRWYDVGKFYDRKGELTGYYCDIIRPVTRLLSTPSKTAVITDLFLDLWINPEGRHVVLDENELNRAIAKRVIPAPLAAKARMELQILIRMTRSGRFPGRWIREFTPISISGHG